MQEYEYNWFVFDYFEQIFLKVAEDNGVDAEMSGKTEHILLSRLSMLSCKHLAIVSLETYESLCFSRFVVDQMGSYLHAGTADTLSVAIRAAWSVSLKTTLISMTQKVIQVVTLPILHPSHLLYICFEIWTNFNTNVLKFDVSSYVV